MTKASVLLLFVTFSIISPAQSDWQVPKLVELVQADQIRNHKPPLSAMELEAVRKVTAHDISKCSEGPSFENQFGENLFQALGVRRFPVAPDGSEALIVQGWGACMCGGVGNCRFWVIQVGQNGYRVLLSTSVIQTFAILNTSTAGYYDIVTGSHDSALETKLRKYHFDGKRYRKFECAEMSYQSSNFEELKKPRISREPCR